MAFIVLHTGKAVTVAYEIAVRLQSILDGKVQGSEAEQTKAGQIKKIYFARDTMTDQPINTNNRYERD